MFICVIPLLNAQESAFNRQGMWQFSPPFKLWVCRKSTSSIQLFAYLSSTPNSFSSLTFAASQKDPPQVLLSSKPLESKICQPVIYGHLKWSCSLRKGKFLISLTLLQGTAANYSQFSSIFQRFPEVS